CFFFFQAEDGIRDRNVTGVQTCALPISSTPIAEVLVGASVAATRQNAGRLSSVPEPGGVKLPAGTDCVVMAVVPGGSAAARLSQIGRAAGRGRGEVAGGGGGRRRK